VLYRLETQELVFQENQLLRSFQREWQVEVIFDTPRKEMQPPRCFGFLQKKKNCGNSSFSKPKFQTSPQRDTEAPLPTTHESRPIKSGDNFITSLHQKDPTILLKCGGTVCK
jgi:hypothetical protein